MAVEHVERTAASLAPPTPPDPSVERHQLTTCARVLIVSDARMYRDGLAMQLAVRDGIEVVGAVESEALAKERILALAPDVILVDMALPGGLNGARAIAATRANAQVIVFAVPDNEVDVPACAEAGVAGFVTRDASADDLVAAVLGVARGEIVCSPKSATALYRRLASLSASKELASPPVELTSREREICALIDRGLSNKEIARLLGIGVATAKNHVHHILEKLQVGRRRDISARLRNVRV